MNTQPKTGRRCICKPGQARDNCPQCEGTGYVIDFAALRKAKDPVPPRPAASAPLSGRYRTEDGKALITWELEAGELGPKFSACGEYDRGAGQCIAEIASKYPQDLRVQRIARVWEKYHLNDMNAGTPEQARALDAAQLAAADQALKLPNPKRFFYNIERRELNPHTLGTVAGLEDSSYYAWSIHVLKAAGLYEVFPPENLRATGGMPEDIATAEQIKQLLGFTVSGSSHGTAAAILKARGYKKRGYRYGECWIFNPIPADVLAEIASWEDFGPDDGKSLGDHQSAEFLKRNGIACRMTRADSKPAPWDIAGHHYRITLSRRRTNGRMTFDFWDSAANAQAGKALEIHSVFSCISSDIGTPETFEEFCSEFGEDTDSIKAKQTFTRADRHARKLRAFFTHEEKQELSTLR